MKTAAEEIEHNRIDPHLAEALRSLFGERLQERVKLDRLSSAKVGGVADFLLVCSSSSQLEADIRQLWAQELPFKLLGGASNVLISEQGVQGLVLVNHAREIRVKAQATPPSIWAESGALLSLMVKKAATASLSGLEWGTSLPGTLGGAIYGNAGAFGSEISQNLIVAEILHRIDGKQYWTGKEFLFEYRSSVLKRQPNLEVVILSAELELRAGEEENIYAAMQEVETRRFKKQPPGACTGSMFKNPPGDFAGRLIEAAGLKGTKVGDVEISQKHGNFFINNGNGTANDFKTLIDITRRAVQEQFGVSLELEVELIGEWESD